MSRHLVLLGDSVSTTAPTPARSRTSPPICDPFFRRGWKATLCAVDGSTTEDLAAQLLRVPRDASHAVVSIGGNDALLDVDLLATPVGSTTEALELFHDRIGAFEESYRQALERVLRLGLSTTVCTVYNGNLPDLQQARVARIALMMFNDVIFRTALEQGLPILDLRLVCNEPEDYANPIEPSGRGGAKIARAILGSLGI
jgi:hypothetical protein